jgi:hypothetical protein
MLAEDAKHTARRWVADEAGELPGFEGAFHTGSINELPDEAEISESSDVDVMVMLDGSDPPRRTGKFVYRGVLLEASYIKSEWFPTPESVLGHYHMAGAFAAPGNIVADPSGRLSELHAAVSKNFSNCRWVHKRLEHAEANAIRFLRSLDDSEEFHDRATAWLFGTGVMTHMLLVAGLENPTVRKRYAAARSLLEEHGRLDFHETLLEQLGCARTSRERVEHHLEKLAEAFDAAKEIARTPFFFASDISDTARPIAINGSREMIEAGHHREAVFWMAATYARCRKILHTDAPGEIKSDFAPGFHELLADLGVSSSADLRERAKRSEEFLPRVREVAGSLRDGF